MPEDEILETVEDADEKTSADILTCEGAKKEILRLIDERQELEKLLLERFDRKVFKEKKQLDRTIRNLFQDFAVCNIEEEPPKETTDSSVSPDQMPPA